MLSISNSSSTLSYTNVLYMLGPCGYTVTRESVGREYPLLLCGPCTVNPRSRLPTSRYNISWRRRSADATFAQAYLNMGAARKNFLRKKYKNRRRVVPRARIKYKRAVIADLDGCGFSRTHSGTKLRKRTRQSGYKKVMRAVTRGCRFCQAGFYIPPRTPKKR